MLDLKKTYLDELKKILATYVPTCVVWAYGSRVNGQAHGGSDLDLVIRNPVDLNKPSENFAALKTALIDSNIPILVDIVDWAVIPESFYQQIEQRYEVVYP